MELKFISSLRKNRKLSWLDIVYEWEDELCKQLNLKVANSIVANRYVNTALVRGFHFLAPVFRLFHISNFLAFVTSPGSMDADIAGSRHAIPWLIDFWLRDDKDLKKFYHMYDGCPMVLISNREAYDYLIEKKCPLPIRHLALSLPDMRFTPECFSHPRKYDCVVVGRPNPLFMKWIERYAKSHSDFVYAYNTRTAFGPNHYVTSTGINLDAALSTREGYFDLLRSSRIGLYSTPSMDGGRTGCGGYNQVTPRLLEYLSAGCHVVGRYPDNSDTRFYDLKSIVPNVQTYEQFEEAVDFARQNPIDSNLYSDYLRRHLTSVRAMELQEILKGLK